MTVKECYEKLGGDYNEALQRLMNEALVKRFILKFLNDDSMKILTDAVSEGDFETAFRGVHTLKGVAANLAFTDLRKAASELTEQLRNDKTHIDEDLYARVIENYDRTISAIKEFSEQ